MELITNLTQRLDTVENNFILSTSEKAIGEDVDGSTIYSKTYTGTGAPVNGTIIDSSITTGAIKWVEAQGCFYTDGEIQQMLATAGDYLFHPRVGANGLYFRFASFPNVGVWHMTIKYAKTS